MKVRIFAGTGGVGKTSIAAASALRAALDGARCLVLTIDPAGRLKTALGMSTAGRQNRVELEDCSAGGELWSAQLDVSMALEEMVRRTAKPEYVDFLLRHPLYNALRSLAGMQELMAIERIDRALKENFDHVVVDTAPSRHALDFLDKPEYLAKLVSAPLVKLAGRTWKWWKDSPLGRAGSAGMEIYVQIEKLVGAKLTHDVLEFFEVFQRVAETYARDAKKTIGYLRDPKITAFTIVSSPFKARADAGWFFDELRSRRFAVDTLIVNRVWPPFRISMKPDATEEARQFLSWYLETSAAQQRATERVRDEFGSKIPRFMTLRELSSDIDGLPALRQIAELLGAQILPQ